VAGKFHFLFRQPIEKEQHDHARHANPPRNCRNHFVIGCGDREIAPTLEIVGQEIVCLIRRDDMSVTSIDQGKGASCCSNVDRLPETIQHQDLTVERRVHVVFDGRL